MNLIIHTDGGSRGNPGPGAIGVVIAHRENDTVRTIGEFGKKIGVVTNNEAEYQAVIEALQEVIRMKYAAARIQFVLDSKLVREQLSGNWKIKEERLRNFAMQVHDLIRQTGAHVSFTHVLREQNKRADELLNQALDQSD